MNTYLFSNIKRVDSFIGDVYYDLFYNDIYIEDSINNFVSLRDGRIVPFKRLFFQSNTIKPSLKDLNLDIPLNNFISLLVDLDSIDFATFKNDFNNLVSNTTLTVLISNTVVEYDVLKRLIALLDKTGGILSFEVRFINSVENHLQVLDRIKKERFNKITKLIFYNADKSYRNGMILFTRNSFKPYSPVNIINLFSANMLSYNIAKRYNLYYYNRLSIDENLNNISQVNKANKSSSNNINSKSEYYEHNHIVNKDKVEFCKQCPLRYGCLDSRIPEKIDDKYKIKNVKECGIEILLKDYM